MSATTTSIDAGKNRLLPVQLLRDGHGIYGIGVSDMYYFGAAAWSSGVEQPLHRPPPLILRPDWFIDTEPSGAAATKNCRWLPRWAFHALVRGATPTFHPP